MAIQTSPVHKNHVIRARHPKCSGDRQAKDDTKVRPMSEIVGSSDGATRCINGGQSDKTSWSLDVHKNFIQQLQNWLTNYRLKRLQQIPASLNNPTTIFYITIQKLPDTITRSRVKSKQSPALTPHRNATTGNCSSFQKKTSESTNIRDMVCKKLVFKCNSYIDMYGRLHS